jgi:hypothetical protein
MELQRPLRSISDDELLLRLANLTRESRRVEADLVAHIAEVEERRLYAREASPSMYAYCTEVLHLSEAEAYLRIAAARASLEHPTLLAMLADGRLHLSGIGRLAPYLTRENRDMLLGRATHRSKREILELIAELFPRPDAPALMRKLPDARQKTRPAPVAVRPDTEAGSDLFASSDDATHSRQLCPDTARGSRTAASTAQIEPLAPARYKVQFTASAALHAKLERLQALMRSAVPDGDLAALIEQAVTEKLERLEARRFATTKAPKSTLANTDMSKHSRRVPAAVRRAVRERDGDRCRFEDARGRRCRATERLEFHHRRPFGHGGDHSPENVSLICRMHNQLLAEYDYGASVMARYRRSADRACKADGA